MLSDFKKDPTDFRKDGLWATKLGFYKLWFDYLALSPSYELARLHRANQLTSDQEARLPTDFDRVLEVFDDFGDVQRTMFFPWWRERGMELCGFQGAKPKVSKIAALKRSKPETDAILDDVTDYMSNAWTEQGNQNTLLVAIPIGLPKARIAKQINTMLDAYPKQAKQIAPPEPKYSLAGKRQNKEMLFRYMHVLLGRAAAPDLALWRVGARTKVSDTYSPELDYMSEVVPNEDQYDRMMLTILTSRALQRGRLIAENAARGVFPSYAKCDHAVEFDYQELNKRFLSRQRWQKAQKQNAGTN
ncbi:hypothetical protein [uncultured Aliiroseovarius sp.]|uniref:hypothetical protein n=1 Tax=uncultured Aliiroseovarius sp. TaxID=1658783 RepID=UPI0026255F31|nr:hypothetical protein [uncultured Aliiroseovarius sp.]